MTLSPYARVALGYAATGSLWILGSDFVLGAWSGGDLLGHVVGSLKGLAFVAVTATVLYLLLERLNRRERDRYRALFDHHPAAMLLIDGEQGTIVDANPAACSFYGWSREELQRMTVADLNQATPDEVRFEIGAAREGRNKVFHFRHRLASGEIRDVEVRSGLVPTGGQPLLCSIVHDETDRNRIAQGLQRHEQLSAAISEIVGAINGMSDTAHVYDTLCRVLVARAGLRFAWVGAVDSGSGSVLPVSRFGDDHGHLDRAAAAPEAGSALGHGPCDHALAEARTFVCNDVAADPLLTSCREDASVAGVAAVAAVPIRRAGQVVAVVNLCAGSVGYFGDGVVQLLERLAIAVSTALDHCERREHDLRAQSALALAEERARTALACGGHAVWEWDAKSGCVYFSEEWKEMIGYTGDEIGGTLQEWRDRVHPDDLAAVDRELAAVFSGDASQYVCEHRLRCKDGSFKWIADRGRVTARDASGAPLTLVGTRTEISDRCRNPRRCGGTVG